MKSDDVARAERGQPWTAWRVVLMFGFVSLAADMVYEGARSLYGPLLASRLFDFERGPGVHAAIGVGA